MLTRITRRSALTGIGACAATASLVPKRRAHSAAPAARTIETRVISQQSNHYHGWPTLARRRNGELLLVCSGGRKAHVCPFGRVELMRSGDEGRTWSWPRVVMDGPIDDRDAGVLETAKGSILLTTFTSLAYEPILLQAQESGDWPDARLKSWQAVHNRISAEKRKGRIGRMDDPLDRTAESPGRLDTIV